MGERNKEVLLMPLRRIEMNKNNELIHITFNHKPSPMQRKIWDIVLYTTKKELERLKHDNPKKYEVFKEEGFDGFFMSVKVDLRFMMSVIKVSSQHKKELIENIREISQIQIEQIIYYGKPQKLKDDTIEKYAHKIEGIDYENIKEWKLNHIMINPKIDFENEIFTCNISPLVLQYADKKKDYTRIDVLVNAFFGSTYTINLYEILLNKFKAQKEMMEKGIIEKSGEITTSYIDIASLKKLMGIKEGHALYVTKHFNNLILKKAIKEINETEVTEFIVKEYNFKKKGRKIVAVSFVLEERKDRQIPFLLGDKKVVTKNIHDLIAGNADTPASADAENTNDETNEIIQKLRSDDIKFVEFVKLLKYLKNYNLAANIDGYEPHLILRTNDLGFLELYDPFADKVIELDGKKDMDRLNALKMWLFRNRKRLGEVENIDYEKLKLQALVGKYLIKEDENGLYRYVEIEQVENIDDDKLKIAGKDLLDRGSTIEFELMKNDIEKLHISNEKDSAKIAELMMKNKKILFTELERIYNEHKDRFEDYVNALSEKILEYDFESNEYKTLFKIFSKASSLVTGEREPFFDDYDVLNHFSIFLKNRGLI